MFENSNYYFVIQILLCKIKLSLNFVIFEFILKVFAIYSGDSGSGELNGGEKQWQEEA